MRAPDYLFLLVCLGGVSCNADGGGDEEEPKGDGRMAEMGSFAQKAIDVFLKDSTASWTKHGSGMQYSVLQTGTSPDAEVCCARCKCDMHYDIFALAEKTDVPKDSTRTTGDTATARPGDSSILPGISIALKMMKAGDKWELILPPELGYELTGSAELKIAPMAALRVVLELVKVKQPKETKVEEKPKEPLPKWAHTSEIIQKLGSANACAACEKVAGYIERRAKQYQKTGKSKKKRIAAVQLMWDNLCSEEVIPALAIHNDTESGRPLYIDDREGLIHGKSFVGVVDNWEDVKEDNRQDVISMCSKLKDAMLKALANTAARYDGRLTTFPHRYFMCGPLYTKLCAFPKKEDWEEDAYLDPADLPQPPQERDEL